MRTILFILALFFFASIGNNEQAQLSQLVPALLCLFGAFGVPALYKYFRNRNDNDDNTPDFQPR